MLEDFLSDLLEDAVDVVKDVADAAIDVAKDGIDYVAENGGDELMDMAKKTASTAAQALYDRLK